MSEQAKCPRCQAAMESGALIVPGAGPLIFVRQETFVWLDGNYDKATVRGDEIVASKCPSCGLVELRTRM